MQQQRQNVSVNQNQQNKTDSIALALQRYRLPSIVESKINLGTLILSSPSLTSEDVHPLTTGNKLWAFSSPVKTFSFLRDFLSLVAQLVVSISDPLLASCWDGVGREALFWTQHHTDICAPQHTKWASVCTPPHTYHCRNTTTHLPLQTHHQTLTTADTPQHTYYCRHTTGHILMQTHHSTHTTADTPPYTYYCRHTTAQHTTADTPPYTYYCRHTTAQHTTADTSQHTHYCRHTTV